jgi:hypothetical protein
MLSVPGWNRPLDADPRFRNAMTVGKGDLTEWCQL